MEEFGLEVELYSMFIKIFLTELRPGTKFFLVMGSPKFKKLANITRIDRIQTIYLIPASLHKIDNC